MSFFRNIRNMTRGKSSSRDTTPVRTSTSNSRPGSVISSATRRSDSMESRSDSLFNRSDTFILNSDDENKSQSNTSTLEKKSKKSRMLSKFSTFTKRKKTPSPEQVASYEHHPSDNATNTYYKWKSEVGPTNLDYDSQTDPFNFLYEQQSSLKSFQNTGSGSGSSTNLNSNTEASRPEYRSQSSSGSTVPFDSSTYRKSKMPTQLKEQLEQLKTQSSADFHEEEPEPESEKYKTVTLNSFRKSFRDKFLQQQKDVPHNPAWFVEVEAPEQKPQDSHLSKENRPDFLVFDNDNYRPNSRSPVRDRPAGRSSRSNTRSPVKRNETFRVERPSLERLSRSKEIQSATPTPSIRIEIKNSITPNMPGRIVPVGVAKPMPSLYTSEYYHHSPAKPMTSSTRLSTSPLRNWSKPTSASPARNASSVNHQAGRYQTLVQIRNEVNAMKPMQPSPNFGRSRLSTRIQLGGNSSTSSPTAQKRYNSAGTRYSPATPLATTGLSSYELLKNSTGLPAKAQKSHIPASQQLYANRKHTYFGDSQMHPATTATTTMTTPHSRLLGSSIAAGRTTLGSHGTGAPVNKFYPQPLGQSRSRVTSGAAAVVTSSGSGGYMNRRDQQPRVMVPVQRRSRSPIKMPWR